MLARVSDRLADQPILARVVTVARAPLARADGTRASSHHAERRYRHHHEYRLAKHRYALSVASPRAMTHARPRVLSVLAVFKYSP